MNASNTILTDRLNDKFEAIRATARTIGGVASLAFPAIFLFGTTALETAQTGYNRVSETISELVWGTTGWVENVLFLSFAISLSILALRMRAAFFPLVAAALGFVIIAIFPTQAPGTSSTIQSLIHQNAAQGIALVLPVACFCLTRKLRSREENHFIVTCNITAGVIGIILNLAGFLAVYGETQWVGAAERLVMLNGLVWLQLVSIHLWLLRQKPQAVCAIDIGRMQSFTTMAAQPEAQAMRIETNVEYNNFRRSR